MITSNVYHRVFHIRYGKQSGTAFTLDIDQKQYLITARHIVEVENTSTIEILHDEQWKTLQVTPIKVDNKDVDINVLAPAHLLSPPLPLPVYTNHILAYDVYFLGFPYDLAEYTHHQDFLNNFPVPLVKKGIISAIIPEPTILLLDGHNNPGFSGGPIVVMPPGEKQWHVAGVISGFRDNKEPVLYNDQPTGMTWQYNTGIVIGYTIEYAIEAIQKNPIGFSLSSL